MVSEAVVTQISDHSLVYTVLKLERFSLEVYRTILKKSWQDPHMVPFHIIDIFDDVDDMLYAFEQLCTEILIEHAPLKQTVIRGNQVGLYHI